MSLLTFFILQQAESPRMTTAGWAFLIIAWAAITFVTVWTFSIILRKK